jgi:hypothetical protein
MGWAGIHAVEYEAVEMGCQIQSGSESLDRRYRATLALLHAMMSEGATALIGEERSHEGAEHPACELGIPGAAIT